MRHLNEMDAALAEVEDGRHRLCILGGTSNKRRETELLAGAIAEGLLTSPGKTSIAVFTEGMPGVQQAFCDRGEGLQFFHLVPRGQACSWPGKELMAGKDIQETKVLFSLIGDVYIVLEGGPEVAAQVKQAFRRGAIILPLVRTGGAAAGQFSISKDVLLKPSFATEEQWNLLCDDCAAISSTAKAVVSLVEAVLQEFPNGCGRAKNADCIEEPMTPESPTSSKPLLPEASSITVTKEDVGAIRKMLRIENGSAQGLTLDHLSTSDAPAPVSASSYTPFLRSPSRPRLEIPAPTRRQKAAFKRRNARDEWNTQEILLHWAISRHPGRHVRERLDLPAPLADEFEFRHYFNLIFPSLEIQLWDDETSEKAVQQLNFAFQCADRDGDGFVTVRELHYGLQCAYGYQSLTSDAVRLLSFTPVTAERLQDLMESLNEGIVSAAEVQGVLREAKMIGGSEGREGRPALLWALGGWYVNVERCDSSWMQVLIAAVRRWIPSDEEHHGRMLHDLARMTMELPKNLPLPTRLGGQRLKEAETASRASQACILTLSVLIHIFYLCMLIFPSVLFGIMIYLGSEHGDDRCPLDLDALLVWFGALGMAVLVMDCANDGRLFISVVVYTLKVCLALTPLLGMAWTHSLKPDEDAQICGPYVFWTSKWIWSAIASCELYVACLLAWSFHVARNHERALRRAASDD